jgi:hypothetical protein
VGTNVEATLGIIVVGFTDGIVLDGLELDGILDGSIDIVGFKVGATEGFAVGVRVGLLVDGMREGLFVGEVLGLLEGAAEGKSDGDEVAAYTKTILREANCNAQIIGHMNNKYLVDITLL